MLKFIIRRLLQMILVFFGATIILFSALFLFGNPADNLTGARQGARRPTLVHQLNVKYGLDKPIYVQYYKYVEGLVVRVRPRHQLPAAEPRRSASILPPKLLEHRQAGRLRHHHRNHLSESAVGIISAVFQYSFLDIITTILTTVTIGIPVFVIGLLLQEIFVFKLHWLPFFVRTAHSSPTFFRR